MKDLFNFKRFRKYFIPLCCFLIFNSLMRYFYETIPYTISDIIKENLFLFLIYFITCFLAGLIANMKSRNDKKKFLNAGQFEKQESIIKELLKFKRFQKNFIPLCYILASLSVLKYFNKNIPYTISGIIKENLFLFLIYFIACFLVDLILAIRSRHNKKTS